VDSSSLYTVNFPNIYNIKVLLSNMGCHPSRPVKQPASQPSSTTAATPQPSKQVYQKRGIESRSYQINASPDIRKDSIIIGLCGTAFPHTEDAMIRNGWLLADFYGWNYLMKIIGNSQDWLTAVDPTALIDLHGNILHGDNRGVRKVVLSHNLLKSGDLTVPIVTEPDELAEKFLERVEARAKEAREKNVPLVIFMSCHGVFRYMIAVGEKPKAEQEDVISSEEVDYSIWLKPEAVVEKIGTGVDAMVVYPDSFGDGWVMYPSLESVQSFETPDRRQTV
jgi:hypothetical protein